MTRRESGDSHPEGPTGVDGSRRFGRAERSQSEVLGTVLILGLSMTVIGTSLALGGVAVGDLISDAESTNVETGMAHMSSKISLVALGDADSQRFSLGAMQEGTLAVRPDAGSIRVYNATGSDRELLNDNRTTMGALVYVGEDREIAYQGGGIWTKQGNASRMTSPPEYHYRGTTLTLPIINVTGEGVIGGRPDGRITPVTVAEDAVPGVSTPLESGTIEIEIQSDYYQGWYAFLDERTEGETEIYHSNRTVVSRLVVPDTETFDNALSVETFYEAKGSADIDEPVEDFTPHRSADPLIDNRIATAEADGTGNGSLSASGGSIDAGTYYIDGDLVLTDDLDIDTSSGNVTIIVDGEFDIQNNDVTVTDSSDHHVEYYVADSFNADGNGYLGTASVDAEPARNRLFIGNGFLDDSSGGGTVRIEAIVYAPDADIETSGTVDIVGSIVANSLDVKGNFNLEYKSSLAETTVELTGAADLLKYLHVSHNEVRVDPN
ncbi:DUF7289 family protein [Halohasta salina]|uniref:DUF7289 family protein n=1 Tax=Halohasta salina TaxID=2961621 RepID=UPI0020A32D12|nr:hypothetical protein [Halohasta salina]